MKEETRKAGIHYIEIYIPKYYISLEKLEIKDQVSKGKYTKGLGQEKMAFPSDLEDPISMSLSVVRSLIKNAHIQFKDIGRIEIGSETSLDNSKSIKTYLMDLFISAGNTDIEGLTNVNACYGGTAALFNAIDWIESPSFDGRYAIVVCTDIANYDQKAAIPTGGAGAIGILVGSNAPIVFKYPRSSYSVNCFDFYKPISSLYPIIDGKLSIYAYLNALSNCYTTFCNKYFNRIRKSFNLKDISFFCFHCPFTKLVFKGFNNLYSSIQKIEGNEFLKFCEEGTRLSKNIGNIYCGSLFLCLASALIYHKFEKGDNIFMFSYGSGLCSSIFLLEVNEPIGTFQKKANTSSILNLIKINEKFKQRIEVNPEVYENLMHSYMQNLSAKNFIPQSKLDSLFPGSYYLEKVDSEYRRYYKYYESCTEEKIIPKL